MNIDEVIKMYYISMIVVIVASVLYHVTQKSIGDNANPAVSMIITYLVALVLSVISIFFIPTKNISESFKELNWASYALGISIFLIELGYLLVYRSGWNINIAALFSNIITALILIMIGFTLYSEKLSTVNIIGVLVSIIGIVLMKK